MKGKMNKIGLLVLLFAASSCKELLVKPTTTSTTPTTTTTGTSSKTTLTGDAAVNDWIYEVMKTNYYWTDKMPAKDQLGLVQKPDSYFDTILFQKDVTDRFSWIQESAAELKASFQGVSKSYGFRFTAFTVKDSDRIILSVRYPVKGGPAEKAGLKRGDVVSKIDGQVLTTANWVSLAYPDQPTSTNLGLANYVSSTSITETDKVIKITAEEVTENPIYFNTVITKGSKKVGYLVYNQFINTSEAGLRAVFADFKAKGVNELILDLRFNGGGYVSTSKVLASLIGKGVDASKNFAVYEYNKTIDAANKKQYGNDYSLLKFASEPNNIGANLSRLFVLTSKGTASASELIINGLRPFMPVVIVGDNTYGKNVGSYTIEDTNTPKRWNWGLQPITFKTTNANGESDYGTKDGFSPSYAQKDNKLPFLQFGDEKETLLSMALGVINGDVAMAKARIGNVNNGTTEIQEPARKNPARFNMLAEPLK